MAMTAFRLLITKRKSFENPLYPRLQHNGSKLLLGCMKISTQISVECRATFEALYEHTLKVFLRKIFFVINSESSSTTSYFFFFFCLILNVQSVPKIVTCKFQQVSVCFLLQAWDQFFSFHCIQNSSLYPLTSQSLFQQSICSIKGQGYRSTKSFS